MTRSVISVTAIRSDRADLENCWAVRTPYVAGLVATIFSVYALAFPFVDIDAMQLLLGCCDPQFAAFVFDARLKLIGNRSARGRELSEVTISGRILLYGRVENHTPRQRGSFDNAPRRQRAKVP